jgi:putative acetyltransferase
MQEDLSAIFEIYDQSKLDELKYETSTFSLLPLEKDEIRLSKLMEADIYVYQEQERICAYGAVCGNEIRALFVHPEFRGKEIGKKLLEFMLSLIQGQPCLYVARSNHLAKCLYAGYGFKVTETFETIYNQQPVIAQKMVCDSLI